MREIKFRGMNLCGKWVYGDLRHDRMCMPDGKLKAYISVCGEPIFPKSVGQYTGRKDRNGVLMFEGDLVELPNLGMTDKAPAEVVWNEDDAKFELFGYDTAIDFSNVYSHEIVVVGNIYENPELGKSRD